MPSTEEFKKELERVNAVSKWVNALKKTAVTLLTVAAISVLTSFLWLPVLKTYGHSMMPTINSGDVLVSVKNTSLKRGDIAAFYLNNKILVKRVIACPGDTVKIEADGRVYINNSPLNEPYIKSPYSGETDIDFPLQVPESAWFVLGDNREASVDSRNSEVGLVYEDQMIGKVIFRIWPLKDIGVF